MKQLLVVLSLVLTAPAFAQDAVPVIAFQGSDPIKMPKDKIGRASCRERV